MISSNTINAITQLIPLLTMVTKNIVDVAKNLRNDGYDIPSVEELEELNNQIRNLKKL